MEKESRRSSRHVPKIGMSGRGFKKGKGAGFQAFVSFCRSSVSACVSYGIALLLLWPIKGGPIRRRGRHAASATTTEPSPNRSSPLKPSSASTYTPPPPPPHPTDRQRYCRWVVRSTIGGVAIGFVFGREYSSGTPRPS